jgi:RimJ/RimL family protein N-acetyltransferase
LPLKSEIDPRGDRDGRNEYSKQVAEKAGAHYEGILLNRMVVGKNVYDAQMYSLVPSDFGLVAQL